MAGAMSDGTGSGGSVEVIGEYPGVGVGVDKVLRPP